nr:uncharacterized protein LOC106677942 isoform X2 [Halyomorpha halys]
MGEPKPESNYFFHKSLKDIWKNSEKPLFSLVGNDDHNETDNPPSSSKSASNSNAVSEKTCNDLGENSQKLNFVDLRSWKESFFFTPNDDRLKDDVKLDVQMRKCRKTMIFEL